MMIDIPAVGGTGVLAMGYGIWDMGDEVWGMRYGEWADVMRLAAIRASRLSPLTSSPIAHCLPEAVF